MLISFKLYVYKSTRLYLICIGNLFVVDEYPYFIGPSPMNLTDAKRYCYEQNAHLAILSELEENERITGLKEKRMCKFSFK